MRALWTVVALLPVACGDGEGAEGVPDGARADGPPHQSTRTCVGADPAPEASVDEETNCFALDVAYGTRRLCLNDMVVVCDAVASNQACELSCDPEQGWMPSLSWNLRTVEIVRRAEPDLLTGLELVVTVDADNQGAQDRGLDIWQYLDFSVGGSPAAPEYFPGSMQQVIAAAGTMSMPSITLNFGVPSSSLFARAEAVEVRLRERPTLLAPFGPPLSVAVVDSE